MQCPAHNEATFRLCDGFHLRLGASGFFGLFEGGGADTTLSAHWHLVRQTHAVCPLEPISQQRWQRFA
jgi:hypothetical protein